MKNRGFLYFVFLVASLLWAGFWYARPYDLFIRRLAGISLPQLLLAKGTFKKDTQDRTNFLLLGRAGGDFDSPDLTDSIIVVSLDRPQDKIYTIAVPRDIWSPSLNDKINTTYFYGKAKGKPFLLAKAEVEKIVGLPIHYGAVINFDKFEKLIDYLAGVDIYVERSFEDFKYPIAGRADDPCGGDPEFRCRYEHLVFKRGMRHMDGTTALKFARSRHSSDLAEGTDFARGARQQKVMSAIYQKLMTRIKKINLTQAEELYQLVNALVERDIENREVLFLLKEMVWTRDINVSEITIPKNHFITPPYKNYGGKYVLLPASGNFDAIHRYLKSQMQTR